MRRGTGCPSPRAPCANLVDFLRAVARRNLLATDHFMRRVDGETYHIPCHDPPEANLPFTLPPASGEKTSFSPTTRSRDSIRDAAPPAHATHGSATVPHRTARI